MNIAQPIYLEVAYFHVWIDADARWCLAQPWGSGCHETLGSDGVTWPQKRLRLERVFGGFPDMEDPQVTMG